MAGTAGGRALKVPPKGTRPTSERVREAIFSRLEHYDALDGARVLDLFAGSGALGLESASRGAETVVLVEANRTAASICQENARMLQFSNINVVLDRAENYATRAQVKPWDLVFLDPPYDLSDDVMTAILASLEDKMHEAGVIVVERASRSPKPTIPASWRLITDKNYGDTTVYYYEPDLPDPHTSPASAQSAD